MTRKLEEYNSEVCQKILHTRPALSQNAVNDVEKLDKFLETRKDQATSSAGASAKPTVI